MIVNAAAYWVLMMFPNLAYGFYSGGIDGTVPVSPFLLMLVAGWIALNYREKEEG